MHTIYLSAEHERFRTETRELLAQHVTPHIAGWERDRRVPRPLWRILGRQGLLGLSHPREFGGTDRDILYSVVFLEELGATGSSGLRAAVSVHAYMASYYLAKAACAQVRRAYLSPAITGEAIAALAVTEPEAGSDVAGIRTTAVPENGRYVVDGTKTMVTNGTRADFYVVAVRTGDPGRGAGGISLLLVDSGLPGITVEPLEKLGWHCADTAEIRFRGVRVPEDRLLGERDGGFYLLMRGFQLERLVAAALAVGGMDRCLADILHHVTERPAFGQRLADLQVLRHRVADFATELTAARHLVYHAAWRYRSDPLAVTECSMAKLYATELACRMADAGLQVHGAGGYRADSAAARTFRDARAATMAAGPSEVMRDIIARMVIEG